MYVVVFEEAARECDLRGREERGRSVSSEIERTGAPREREKRERELQERGRDHESRLRRSEEGVRG